MRFMNEFDIESAHNRYRNHPVLGKATRFLLEFMNEVNAHSDGWPYWAVPVRAARQLMELIEDNPERATEAAYRKALTPIKSFYTRRGYQAGMQFPATEIEDTPPAYPGGTVKGSSVPNFNAADREQQAEESGRYPPEARGSRARL